MLGNQLARLTQDANAGLQRDADAAVFIWKKHVVGIEGSPDWIVKTRRDGRRGANSDPSHLPRLPSQGSRLDTNTISSTTTAVPVLRCKPVTIIAFLLTSFRFAPPGYATTYYSIFISHALRGRCSTNFDHSVCRLETTPCDTLLPKSLLH